MMKRIGILLISLMLIVGLIGCSGKKEETEESYEPGVTGTDWGLVIETGVIRIGMMESPLSHCDDEGNWTGFAPDLIAALCRDINITPNFTRVSGDTFQEELDNGRIECVFTGLYESNALAEKADCSRPYLYLPEVALSASGTPENCASVTALKSLKEVGVIAGSHSVTAAALQGLSAKGYPDADSMVQAITDGSIPAGILDQVTLGSLSETQRESLSRGATLGEYGCVIAYAKNSALNARIRESIKKLTENGSLDELAATYGLEDYLYSNHS